MTAIRDETSAQATVHLTRIKAKLQPTIEGNPSASIASTTEKNDMDNPNNISARVVQLAGNTWSKP